MAKGTEFIRRLEQHRALTLARRQPEPEPISDQVMLSWIHHDNMLEGKLYRPAEIKQTIFTTRAYMRSHPVKPGRRRPLYVVAEILDAENVEHARSAGADEVIETRRLGFSLLAHALAMPGTAALMGRLGAAGAHSLYVGACPPIPPGADFARAAQHIKASHGALLLGLRGADGAERINPPDDTPVQTGDVLIYLAERAVLG